MTRDYDYCPQPISARHRSWPERQRAGPAPHLVAMAWRIKHGAKPSVPPGPPGPVPQFHYPIALLSWLSPPATPWSLAHELPILPARSQFKWYMDYITVLEYLYDFICIFYMHIYIVLHIDRDIYVYIYISCIYHAALGLRLMHLLTCSSGSSGSSGSPEAFSERCLVSSTKWISCDWRSRRTLGKMGKVKHGENWWKLVKAEQQEL